MDSIESKLPFSDAANLEIQRTLLSEIEDSKELYFNNTALLIKEINILEEELSTKNSIIDIIVSERRELVATVVDQRKEINIKDDLLKAEKSKNALLTAENERLLMLLRAMQL